MAITAILLAAVMLLFVPVSAAIDTNVVNNDIKLTNKTINDYIERTLSFSNTVNVYTYVDLSTISQNASTNHQFDVLDLISSYCRAKDSTDSEPGSYLGKGMLTSAVDNPGMLIFHYDATEYTYVLYNIPIKILASELSITEASSNTVIQTAVSNFLNDMSNLNDYRVFNTDYYGGYKYLFEISTSETCISTKISTYSRQDENYNTFELKPIVDPTTALIADPDWVAVADDPDCAPYFEGLELNTFDCLNLPRGTSIPNMLGGGYDVTLDGHDTVVLYNMHNYTIDSLANEYFTS